MPHFIKETNIFHQHFPGFPVEKDFSAEVKVVSSKKLQLSIIVFWQEFVTTSHSGALFSLSYFKNTEITSKII